MKLDLKINPQVKYQDLSGVVKSHLSFQSVLEVKWTIGGLLIVLYDLPLLLILLTIMRMDFFWILLPFIILLHLWSIRLLIKNPYSIQLESILFIGILGAIGAVTFLISIQGISYYRLNISFMIFYIILNLLMLASSYILIRYQMKKYNELKNNNIPKKDKNQSKYIGFLTIVPAIGYITGQATADTVVLKHYITLAATIFLMLLYIYVAAKFLHRYFFMKANINYVKFQEPSK